MSVVMPLRWRGAMWSVDVTHLADQKLLLATEAPDVLLPGAETDFMTVFTDVAADCTELQPAAD